MRGGDDRGYDSGIPDAPLCKEEDLDDKSRDASPMLPKQKVIRLFCDRTDEIDRQTDRHTSMHKIDALVQVGSKINSSLSLLSRISDMDSPQVHPNKFYILISQYRMGPSDQRALAEELFEFAKAGDLNNIKRLISQGADIRYQTNNSLCHVAARHNQVWIYTAI